MPPYRSSSLKVLLLCAQVPPRVAFPLLLTEHRGHFFPNRSSRHSNCRPNDLATEFRRPHCFDFHLLDVGCQLCLTNLRLANGPGQD